jgi:hypothetical protein
MAWALVDDDPERNLRLKAAADAGLVDLDVWRSHAFDVQAVCRVVLPEVVVLGLSPPKEVNLPVHEGPSRTVMPLLRG